MIQNVDSAVACIGTSRKSDHAPYLLQLLALIGAVIFGASIAAAAVSPQVSLYKCQKAVRVEAAKFVKKRALAVGACLQKVSSDVIKSNAAVTSTTAKLCVTQFRKIFDSRSLGASLEERKVKNILKVCQPGNSGVTHTLADITGTTPIVPQPINTNNISTWCQRFGGDGSIDTLQEWVDCIDNSHICAADTAISTQYPRALQWFDLVKTAILALPGAPASDPNRYTDALAGLNLVDTAIEGSTNDNIPGIECGTLPTPSCAKACCYVEQPVGMGGPTSCFEYESSSAQLVSFVATCNGKLSSPPGFWKHTGVAGACSAGPMSAVACIVGGPNATQVPKDSACP
jgi:hypothetical protein